MKQFPELFVRSDKNPILTAEQWPYPVHSCFNPGAIKLNDGTVLLLCRVEDRRGISHFTAVRSSNGIDGRIIDDKPTFCGMPDVYPEEVWGVEDARKTYIPETDEYYIVDTAFGRSGSGVAIASTRTLSTLNALALSCKRIIRMLPCSRVESVVKWH